MEKIFNNKVLIAILIKKFKKGVESVTEPLEPLQVLVHKRQEGEYTKAHLHESKKRLTQKLQECLVVLKGKIKVDLYGADKKLFKSIFLSIGQVLILMNGGHAVRLLEDSEIIEIKNGPFIEDKILLE